MVGQPGAAGVNRRSPGYASGVVGAARLDPPPPPEPEYLGPAYDASVAITREKARNFYLAFAALPRPRRRAICVLYAFCRRLDDIADGPGSPAEKAARLQECREALCAALGGQPAEPAMAALADAASRYGIAASDLHDIVAGVEMDLYFRSYPDFAALRRYCCAVAAAPGLASLPIMGCTDPAARPFATALGIAMQLTNIVRDVAEDAALGRVYLPEDELARFDCSVAAILAGTPEPGFDALMRFQIARARTYFQRSAGLFAYLPLRGRLCAALLQSTYSRILDRIAAAGGHPFAQRVTLTSTERAACLAWAVGRALFAASRCELRS